MCICAFSGISPQGSNFIEPLEACHCLRWRPIWAEASSQQFSASASGYSPPCAKSAKKQIEPLEAEKIAAMCPTDAAENRVRLPGHEPATPTRAYIYIYIYIYIYTHMYTHIYIYIICIIGIICVICMCMYGYIYICTHTYILMILITHVYMIYT